MNASVDGVHEAGVRRVDDTRFTCLVLWTTVVSTCGNKSCNLTILKCMLFGVRYPRGSVFQLYPLVLSRVCVG